MAATYRYVARTTTSFFDQEIGSTEFESAAEAWIAVSEEFRMDQEFAAKLRGREMPGAVTWDAWPSPEVVSVERVKLGKYQLITWHNGFAPIEPEAPTLGNTFKSLEDVRRECAERVSDLGTETRGAVHLTETWDGISHGDSWWMQVTVGPRGGVVLEKAW